MKNATDKSTVDKLEQIQGGLKLAFAAVSAVNTVRMVVRAVKEKNLVSFRTFIALGQAVAAVIAVRQAINDFRKEKN